MFTTGAHNCRYVFLITNTDPDERKHKSLTMFLVPLDTPGIEIQGIRTVDGDRTNIVYYSDVRISDKYRLGEVNGGGRCCAARSTPNTAPVGAIPSGLQDVAIMSHQRNFMGTTSTRSAGRAPGSRRSAAVDDVRPPTASAVRRPNRGRARTPHMFGRVALAQTMRDVSPDLMDLLGTASVLPAYTDGATDDGASEYVYRWRRCGNLRRHTRSVPQYDRAAHAGTGPAELFAGRQEEALNVRAIAGGQTVD